MGNKVSTELMHIKHLAQCFSAYEFSLHHFLKGNKLSNEIQHTFLFKVEKNDSIHLGKISNKE